MTQWTRFGHRLLDALGRRIVCDRCPCGCCRGCGATCSSALSSVTIDVTAFADAPCAECTYDIGPYDEIITMNGSGTCPNREYFGEGNLGSTYIQTHVYFDDEEGCWWLIIYCFAIPGLAGDARILWVGCKGGDSPVGEYTLCPDAPQISGFDFDCYDPGLPATLTVS